MRKQQKNRHLWGRPLCPAASAGCAAPAARKYGDAGKRRSSAPARTCAKSFAPFQKGGSAAGGGGSSFNRVPYSHVFTPAYVKPFSKVRLRRYRTRSLRHGAPRRACSLLQREQRNVNGPWHDLSLRFPPDKSRSGTTCSDALRQRRGIIQATGLNQHARINALTQNQHALLPHGRLCKQAGYDIIKI